MSDIKGKPNKLIDEKNPYLLQHAYLNAYCYDKKAYRTFKISRMANIDITEDVFGQRTQVESTAELTDNQIQQFIDIRLKISPEGAYRIYDDFSEEEIIKHEDGSFTVTTSMPEGDGLSNYILSYGPVIEAIEPQSLRDTVIGKMEIIMHNLNRRDETQHLYKARGKARKDLNTGERIQLEDRRIELQG